MLFRSKKTPLNAYDSLMLWHLQESKQLYSFQTLKDSSDFIGRKVIIERLVQRYNFEDKMPFQKKVRLPVSGTIVQLTLHSAKATVQRLLTDPRVKAEDYLFWEPGNPLAPPPENVEIIGNLNTGLAHLDTHVEVITPGSREALMQVVIYFDGTTVSHFHNMEITQVNIALGTHNRLARNKPYCWAPLGYIEKISTVGGRGKDILVKANHLETQDGDDSDDDGLESDDSAKEHVQAAAGVGDKSDQDFHAMMSVILQEFVALQEEGFLWTHHDPATGQNTEDIHYKIFVPFLKLDGKEADLACGKYQNRSNTKQICRKCHIPLAEADDHLAKHKFKTVSEIKKLVDKADLPGLQALSQTYLRNAFYAIRFLVGNKQGVHGSCPAELLHAFLLGTFKYVRDVFFEVMGKDSETARRINALAKVYGKLFARQSDRTMPTTFFTRGIQAGKLMAKDYRGVLLIMLAILRSTKGQTMLKHAYGGAFRDETTLKDWILLVELMLEWESYMNEPEMNMKHVKRLEKKHRYIMYIIRKVAPRKAGMGLKLSKFHTILHIWEDILQFGVPLEYDTSANESFHKPSKTASKLTQKAADTFNYQTAQRLVEFFLIDLAMEEIQKGARIWEYYKRRDLVEQQEIMEDLKISTGDARIRVFENEDREACFEVISQSKHKAKTQWNSELIQFLLELQQLTSQNTRQTLPIYTSHCRNGQVFRGHPNYRGKGPWKDWVWIDWGPGYGRLPAHIWCFVILENMPSGRHTLEHGGIRLTNGVFAVVEATVLDENLAKSDLMTPILKDVEQDEAGNATKRTFYLADTNAFLDPACVVPDLGGPTNRYFVVRPRNQWSSEFLKWIQEEHIKDTMDPLDEYSTEEGERSSNSGDASMEDANSDNEESSSSR